MSLNWSTENVKYFQDNPDELWVTYRKGEKDQYEDVNAETKALIFGSMALGIGCINYKNAPDFYARWKFFEKYDNFYLYSTWDGEKSTKEYLTPKIVLKHFGLVTNVSTESETVWAKRIAKNYAQEHARGYRDNLVTEKEIRAFLRESKIEFETSFTFTEKIGE